MMSAPSVPGALPENKRQIRRRIAVVVAGGKGLRMQSDVKKQYMILDGVPVLVRTLFVFDAHPRVDDMVLVVPESDLAFCRDKLLSAYDFASPIHVIPGGITRQDSVRNGLQQAADLVDDETSSVVLVHDGVRPFVPDVLIDTCLDAVETAGGCIPVLQVSDTVKESNDGSTIDRTLDRSRLYRAQTPQVFGLDTILTAFANAEETGFSGTDEASILEHAGIPVRMVPGTRFNIKLTTPEDLDLASYLLKQSSS
ncbi:MAG: 2-C-methyl-D-erythritol 4-phosphate cytidylyltransferase [Desulfobacterales bacterium]|nr:2-C-methyl-D-erythritol 4-phosphate cytidylyltransferase [Desulfobacterales bacterium]